jgi:hypothetical protein
LALAETANLIVNLGLKGNFARDIGKANRSLDSLVKGESRAYKAGAQIGTGIKNAAKIAAVGVAALASQVVLGLDSLIELEKSVAQTNAVIKSTGGTAGVTANEVRKLAEQYENLNAVIGDEVIQSAENILLTFPKITKQAFEPTLAAVLDLNTALGKGPEGLTSTAIQVGKALQDPERGLLALRRVGVAFSKDQEKRIKGLVKEGKLYEAQKLILAELNKEFGGSFAAQGNTTAGKVAKFRDAIEDLQRSLATALLPTVSHVADALSEFLADPAVIKGAEDLGREIGNLFSKENLQAAGKVIGDVLRSLKSSLPAIKAGLSGVASVIGVAVKAFQSLPPFMQQAVIGGFALNKLTGGLVTNIGGGLIGAVLKQLKSAVVSVQGGIVNVNGPVSGMGGAAGAAAGSAGWLGSIKAVAGVIAPAIAVALASQAVTNETNKQGGTNFANPFAGGIGGNIVTAIHNLTEVVKLAQRRPVDDRAHEGSGQRRTETGKSIDKTTTTIAKLKAAAVPALGKISAQAKIDAAIVAANIARTAGETKQAITTSGAMTGALIGVGTATTRMAGATVSGSVRGVAPPIVSAIRANRPIISVRVNVSATTVSKTVTVTERYGPSGGSADRNNRSSSQPI